MTSAQTDRLYGLVGNTGIKAPVRVATTAAIVLTGTQTIDGVACVAGDRVLVKNQADGTTNGIYVVDTGAWNRSADFDGQYDAVEGTLVHVDQGTANGKSVWRVGTSGTITIGTTSITFERAVVNDASSVGFTPGGAGLAITDVQSQLRKCEFFDTVAAFKAWSAPTVSVTAFVRGYYTAGDGGGGMYVWNGADVSADNGGTVIQPTGVANGRWNRSYDALQYSVKVFGAKGDGVTDDTTAIQKTIDASYSAALGVYTGWAYLPTARYAIGANASVLIRATNGGTRGFKLYGDGPRASVLLNKSTTGRDGLVVGDNAGSACYDVILQDFKVEGNDLDGVGVKFYNTLHSTIRNLFTEFTGSHGFDINNCLDCLFQKLHARRSGYNAAAGRANVAGFKLTSLNQSVVFDHLVAEECNIGVIADTGVFLFKGVLDTESNINRGLQVQGVASIIADGGWSEQHAIPAYAGGLSKDDWLIGDGVNAVAFARILNMNIGNGGYLSFNGKVADYDVVNARFFGSSGGGGIEQIKVLDPTTTRGRITGGYAGSADTNAADNAVVLQHVPAETDALPGNLLGTNGSFEVDLVTGWLENWLGAAGTVVTSDPGKLGFDIGSKAWQAVISAMTATFQKKPNALPVTVAGRFYTVDFAYAATTASLLFTISTNGVRHCNIVLPISTGAHYRVIFKAQGAITDCAFNMTGLGTFKLDAVNMVEGQRGRK